MALLLLTPQYNSHWLINICVCFQSPSKTVGVSPTSLSWLPCGRGVGGGPHPPPGGGVVPGGILHLQGIPRLLWGILLLWGVLLLETLFQVCHLEGVKSVVTRAVVLVLHWVDRLYQVPLRVVGLLRHLLCWLLVRSGVPCGD